jgi:hypothetical protein
MSDHSIKAKRDAWRRAKKAADAVEATALGKKEADAPGAAAHQERLLLDRLRGEERAELVGEAWLHIEQHSRNGDEGQRVIMSLLEAVTLAKMLQMCPTIIARALNV